jgi:hypothetical protein
MKSSNDSCIVKKQNRIPGVVIVVQAVALSLFAGWQSTAALDKQAGAPPLRLSTQGLLGLDKGCKAGEGLIFELHYIGEKPLRGYVLMLDSADSGVMKPKNDEILEEVRGLGEPMILGGQEWTRIICSVPKKILGDPATLSAKIDVLKCEDGSISGPGTARSSRTYRQTRRNGLHREID